ncbi:alpha-(1-_3)-arabinofuranosyltransferase [Gordonia terrae]|nr:alpha-(1->3)-arabinofuranosyltransferase [Gordonia terrae]UPW11894.1 alpha-(1->3)-arabinofuranosyltransferase [Gordonia terrae]
MSLLICLLQSPGRIAADTKLDLTANPLGFLARAAHLWTPNAPMGQVQNQAYGYFFPHGAFYALGDLLALPPWIVQRLWWAVLLTVGFVGIVRLAETLRLGSPASRIIAAVVFVLSPRVLTTLGSISSETLPMMLAPWVLVPVVRALDTRADDDAPPLWREAARTAAAVALMGAVNAVATLAALGVAVLWWLLHSPRDRRWRRFGAWTTVGLALACAWWVVPLLILSRVSPPFLDYIESSRVTTQWTSLTEVLRGASSWTPFVSPERVAGAVLVTQPAAVLATGTIAAAGLAGLCMRHMPFRGRLVTILGVGLVVMCVGYAGELGSPVAEQMRAFLDGSGAPLRNIHKFEPLLRIPLALGVAHLLARVPLPGTAGRRETLSAFAQPQRSRPVAAAIVLLVAVIGAGSLMWTGQLAPNGTYESIPRHWQQTADWLAEHSERDDGGPPARTLVVPGAPFADQLWGLTRDEPLQPLSDTPWAVRDAIPLTPPGAIRALDSVQREIAAGRGSPGLAATLAGQGIGFVVLRADLDPETSRSARPLLAQQALDESPGLRRVAEFGPQIGPPSVRGVVRDNGLRPAMPAVQIFAVDAPGSPAAGTGPRLVDTAGLPRVAGGPEAVAELAEVRARQGLPPLGPVVLDADARRAGITHGPLIVTDTPSDRETDFGRVDDHSSAIRAPSDPRRTQNAVADYPVDGQPLVHGEWLLDNRSGEVEVSTSGAAADAVQPGQTSPANSAAAAFDGNPQSAWVSGGLESAVGRWMRIGFTTPRTDLALTLTTAKALGPDVTSALITTEAGSTVVSGLEPGEPMTVTAPSGATRWVQIRALRTDDGTAGNQFALGEVTVSDLRTATPLRIRHRVVLPELEAGTEVAQWLLYQELSGRASCVSDPARQMTRCAPGLGLSPETSAVFGRALSVPSDATVSPTAILRPRPGDALDRVLADDDGVTARGPRPVTDPRGGPAAAVDGDPGTSWTAPEIPDERTSRAGAADSPDDEDAAANEDSPTLVLDLSRPQRVDALTFVAPRGHPAAPTEVAVDLGTGEQIREVDESGIVRLDPAVTDRIEITIRAQSDLVDVNSLGFASPAPPGIAEVRVSPSPATGTDADRIVDIGCDDGIGLTAAGQVVRMFVRARASDLRSGQPVIGRPCGDGRLALPAGQQEVSVNPGDAFTVDALSLVNGDPVSAPASTSPEVSEWSAVRRAVTVESGPQRLLVVPESTNPGWQARLDGVSLRPVVVDGWQQGWIVPAGAAGTIDLTYRFDSLYRWSLVIGLALMVLLLLAAWWPSARRAPPGEPIVVPAGRGSILLAGGAVLAAAWLVSGWWGLAAAVVVGAVTAALPQKSGVTTAFVAMMAATIGLAAGPWHASGGYHGSQWWVQLPALVAVSMTAWLVFWSAIDGRSPTGEPAASWRERLRRRLSRLRSQFRVGSSMKA